MSRLRQLGQVADLPYRLPQRVEVMLGPWKPVVLGLWQ